jgi:hypothetical protein
MVVVVIIGMRKYIFDLIDETIKTISAPPNKRIGCILLTYVILVLLTQIELSKLLIFDLIDMINNSLSISTFKFISGTIRVLIMMLLFIFVVLPLGAKVKVLANIIKSRNID